MIISHKYKFIFIKTYKTAGSSIELYLSKYCGKQDIVIPMIDEDDWDYARNWRRFIFYTNLGVVMREISRPDIQRIKNGISRLRLGINTLTFKTDMLPLKSNSAYLLVDRYSHLAAHRLRQIVGKRMWNDYYVFCVTRNTWDRLVSFYFWSKYKHARKGLNLKWEDYIEKHIKSEPDLVDNCRLYTDNNRNPIVNKIIRYENLDEEFEQVCDKLGIPFSAWRTHPKAKATQTPRQQDYRSLYTPEVRDLVATNFADEIKLMGYEF